MKAKLDNDWLKRKVHDLAKQSGKSETEVLKCALKVLKKKQEVSRAA